MQKLCYEAAVQEMKDGMFHTADVYIHRHPRINQLVRKYPVKLVRQVGIGTVAYFSELFASGYRKKYQAESTNVSIVSVSLLAADPHLANAVKTKDSPGTYFGQDVFNHFA